MADFAVPVNLADSMHNDGTPECREWLRRLPAVVADLAEAWSLRLGPPYQPGGRCAWVAPARTSHGEDLALKVTWRHDESEHEGDGLRVWNGHSTVRLHNSIALGATDALLLERCVPGTALAVARAEPEQDVIVAGLLRRLWTGPVDGAPFRPLQTMCDAWVTSLELRIAETNAVLDPGLVRAGVELFRNLPASAERQALLHTDLHAGNVLAADREPWLVIDPKPYVGDPTYDALQHLLNNVERLTADPGGMVRRMASLLDLNPERLQQWLFARCVLEAVHEPALRELANRLAPA